MNRVYIKYDGSNVVRFNWPGDPVGEWTKLVTNHSVTKDSDAYGLVAEHLDWNGYVDVLYAPNWEFIMIEEDHDN